MNKMFEELLKINVNDHTESKNGLTYLSWTYAWSEIKKKCPKATYKIVKFENNLPYVYDENTGYMVFTRMTINNETNEMWLPVMDGNNKAMLNHPYTYQVKEYQNGQWTGEYKEKTVEPATMFDINKTIMRCLVKNIAMFGLGLYIYAGEDLPEGYEITPEEAETMIVNFGKYKGKTLGEIKKENEQYLYWIIDAEYDYVKESLKNGASKLVEPIDDDSIELTTKMMDLINETESDYDEILKYFKKKGNDKLTKKEKEEAIEILKKKKEKMEK